MGMNDAAWEILFDKYCILDEIKQHGQFIISARQIKEFREPRLMTKFDHRVNLPQIFSENELAILPISRGDYVISSFCAYQDFEIPSSNVKRISIPAHIQSLMPQFLVSEAIVLNCANACGILSDFLEDEALVPTVSGRMSSGNFAFDINTSFGNQYVKVSNSQIEIDAAYEGIDYLSLFEAKMDLSDDFLVRQLYYPFRVWSNRVTKTVKPVFLIFSNGVFHLYQYQFDEPHNYNSLRLVKQKNYVITTEISLADIENLLRTTPTVLEPEISFPQANSMSRIINLIELLNEKPMTKQDITSEYAFDERQTNYYTDAGRYLDLISKGWDDDGNILFQLSSFGRHIMSLAYKERQLAIVTQILKHKAFKETLKLHLQCGEMPDTETVVQIMRQSNLYHVKAGTTYERRSSTIVGWINWILSIIEE
ncbi:MAG TPA: transcriptional regulator [Candidatus Egerieicola faecale]|uniref:Transcriptional regulator n=1 Tax=Candidatus Egerieicola faecale TaxID=2840774 RepID=A0A9D1LIZ0_9FIRM|nr:transcriptional regulator [Candidatus Egerieicola faecale]